MNMKELQTKLEARDVMIHFPDEYVPSDHKSKLHDENSVDIGHF